MFQQATFEYRWVLTESSNTGEEVPQMEFCHVQVDLQYTIWLFNIAMV